MPRLPETPPTTIELVQAGPEQGPILSNLLELYAHDFSEFHELQIGADGRFGYRSLPLYWSEPGRYAFLVKVNGELSGLVFVRRGSEISGDPFFWDMAEFFVLRGWRRRRVGTQVAHEVWRRFPGTWEVRVMQSNLPAQHFWMRAIGAFTGKTIAPVVVEKGGERWQLFAFRSEQALERVP